MRPRLEPSASRVAISRCREAARASKKLARFAQAISRTSATTAIRIVSEVAILAAPIGDAVSGGEQWHRNAIDLLLARRSQFRAFIGAHTGANLLVKPLLALRSRGLAGCGLRTETARTCEGSTVPDSGVSIDGCCITTACMLIGVHSSTGSSSSLMPWKASGITPMTVNGVPLMLIVLPRMVGQRRVIAARNDGSGRRPHRCRE